MRRGWVVAASRPGASRLVLSGSVMALAIVALIGGLSQMAADPPDVLAGRHARGVVLVDLDRASAAASAALAGEYGFEFEKDLSRLGWTALQLPSDVSAKAAVAILRRDPRVQNVSIAADSPSIGMPMSTPSTEAGAPDAARLLELLTTVGLAGPSNCPTDSVVADPLWPGWDGPLLAVETYTAACQPGGLALFAFVDGKAELAALLGLRMDKWVPGRPHEVNGVSVDSSQLVWGHLNGTQGGPLHPLWLVSSGGTRTLVSEDGSVIPVVSPDANHSP